MRKAFTILLVVLLSLVVFVSCDQESENNTFTVTFKENAEGVTGTMAPQNVTRYYTEKLAANAFTKEGWKFSSWNTKADGSGVSYDDQDTVRLAKDITLYAQWAYNQVSVTFNANGGTGEMPVQKVNKKEATSLNANSFTRDNGYVFNGWNTKADGSGELYADQSKVTLKSDITLYAQWYHDKVTVTFYPNGGTGEVTTQPVNTNIPTDLKSVSFTKESFQLAFWATNADGSGTRYSKYATVTINEDLALYAQWIDADFTIMSQGTTTMGGGGRYTIVDNLTMDSRPTVWFGAATIVLPEGLTLTLAKGINVHGAWMGSLIIEGTGTLIATADEGNAAIGGNSGMASGDITINGGIITATGSSTGGAGIGGGSGNEDDGTLTIGLGATVTVSDDGVSWESYDGTHRKRYMKVNN